MVRLGTLQVHLVIKWRQLKLKNELPLIQCITNSTFDPSSYLFVSQSIVFSSDSCPGGFSGRGGTPLLKSRFILDGAASNNFCIYFAFQCGLASEVLSFALL